MAVNIGQSHFARLLRRWKEIGRAARGYGVSRLAVTAHAWRLRRKYGFNVDELLATGLINPAIPEESMSGRISKRNLLRAQMRLNPKWAIGLATDKAVFYSYAAGLGIPVPPLCAVFTGPTNGFTPKGQILCGLADWQRLFETLPSEFIVKPADACYGSGFNRFSRKDGRFVDGAGLSLDSEGLYRWLASHENSHKLVIQERLWNHSALQKLSGTQSLQTLRLVTYINPEGQGEFFDALFKIIVGDNLTDNFHWGTTGNLVSRLNRDQGTLGVALGASPTGLGLTSHQRHPQTGRQIAGFQLPHFQEAVALVKRTAALLLPLRSIGWDVALTDAGPIIIEGNPWWDPANGIVQPNSPGIIQPTYMELLKSLRLTPADA